MKNLLFALPALLLGACSSKIMMVEDHDYIVDNLQSEISSLQQEKDKLQEAADERDNLKSKYDLLKMEGDHYQELAEEIKKLLEELKNDNVTYSSKGAWVFQSDVLFQSGSANLSEKGKASLKKFSAAWKNKQTKFNIVGHTDSAPIKKSSKHLKTDTNLELGMLRALSVMEFLKKNGIAESRMSVNSKGASEPISKDMSKNRRVEVFVVK